MPETDPAVAGRVTLHVQCKGCGTFALTTNTASPDSAVVCPPDSGCCQDDHGHDQPCDVAHTGPCLTPAACPTWTGMAQEGECPGGHCGLGVDGCTGCRALHITVLAPPDGSSAIELHVADGAPAAILGLEA